MSRILIVDDEQGIRSVLGIAFRQEGHEVVCAEDGEAAKREIEASSVDAVISDIRMPGLDGLELLEFIKEEAPRTEVVLITAHASTETAIEALRLGAYDYIAKPFEVDEVLVTVQNALERKALRAENRYLRRELTDRHRVDDLVGRSPAMREVFSLIDRVADADVTVLITGESGTGKELVARAIHNRGGRREAPFVTINCAALPAQLLESELFGHVKGSFTGADRDKRGLFVEAGEGTLLLDEIGEMPVEMQAKLLRVLEDHRVRPVGATKEIPIQARVLAATNLELLQEARSGDFREDLYYRLNVIQIDIPPLRERIEDVPVLAEHLLERCCAETGREVDGFSQEAKRLLESYAWPGNVRELENAIRRAVTLESGARIEAESLPAQVRGVTGPTDAAEPARGAIEIPDDGIDLEDHLDEIKRGYMLEALSRADGVQKEAASLLGMSFRSFRYYLDKLDLKDRVGAAARGE